MFEFVGRFCGFGYNTKVGASVGVIRTTGDLNRMYGFNYDERDLTELEFNILNSLDEPNVDIDSADVETLAALSIYYNLKIRPEKNEKLVRVLNKLIEHRDDRGYVGLGVYLISKGNYELGVKQIEKSTHPETKNKLKELDKHYNNMNESKNRLVISFFIFLIFMCFL